MDLAHEYYTFDLYSVDQYRVSILVLMDLAHESSRSITLGIITSFNPCFNGSCSRMYLIIGIMI